MHAWHAELCILIQHWEEIDPLPSFFVEANFHALLRALCDVGKHEYARFYEKNIISVMFAQDTVLLLNSKFKFLIAHQPYFRDEEGETGVSDANLQRFLLLRRRKQLFPTRMTHKRTRCKQPSLLFARWSALGKIKIEAREGEETIT